MSRRSGYFKVGNIRGITVFIHWSLPAGGILVSSLGHVDPRQWVDYCVAYTFLVLAHECGHLFTAVSMGLKVFSLEVSGLGGACRIERPRSLGQSVSVYSAGLLVQGAILLLTCLYVAQFGTPSGAFARAVVVTFTFVNAILILGNLVPVPGSRSRLATDGWVLWKLFLHVFRGSPHPHPPLLVLPVDQAQVFTPETRLLDTAGFQPPGFVHGIEILNDQTTPMDLVVRCLMTHLSFTRDEAIAKMLEIHNRGGVLIALATEHDANRIAEAISADSRCSGHHLICRYADVRAHDSR
jgi:ATP-dependent Clp protease adapter protein ClpS